MYSNTKVTNQSLYVSMSVMGNSRRPKSVQELISQRMRLIPSKDTKPELAVRAVVDELGISCVFHDSQLPGSPDIAFPRRRKAVFVHGCFWHQHLGCNLRSVPRANPEYWIPKFKRIKARDRRNKLDLTRLGWQYLVVWECQTRSFSRLYERIARFVRRA